MKFDKQYFSSPFVRYFIIIAVVIISTFSLYLPFLTKAIGLPETGQKTGMQIIYQNYDGLYYIVPAISWYNPKTISSLRLEFDLPLEYYAAHLPGYPFFIALFAPIVGNYLISMIGVNLLFSSALGMFFYYLVSKCKLTERPMILTMVFLFLPRFLVTRSVGAPESLFIFSILVSLFFFEKKQYLLAGIFGALSVMTKVPGILLFGAYSLTLFEAWSMQKKIPIRSISLILIPLGLLAVCVLYFVQYRDFFAFFHTGGVVPMLYPYSVFTSASKWVNTIWLEDVVLYFFLYLYSVIYLKDFKYRSFYYFALLFFIAGVFVQHRDLSRYLLPIWPFTCIALEKLFTSKKFVIVFLILLPAIYLYAVNFLQSNIIPIADWRPFI